MREQTTHESVDDVEAEMEAQCAKLCRRIADEETRSQSRHVMMAGLFAALMKVRQKRIMKHQLGCGDPCLLSVLVHVVHSC